MKFRTPLATLAIIAVCVLPVVAFAGSNVAPVPIPIEGNSISVQDVIDLIRSLINYGIILASLVVVAMIVYAGFKMAWSRGVDTEYKKGKDILKYAIYGAIVIFAVGLIVNTIAYIAEDPANVL